jgi:hypothetical protein
LLLVVLTIKISRQTVGHANPVEKNSPSCSSDT